MDNVAWLLSQEIFGGYKFDSFEQHDMQACAAVVRATMENENFANTLVECVIAAGERLKTIINDGQTIEGGFLASKRVGQYVKFKFWNGPRELARMVEDLVLSALRAHEQFNAMPKLSPKNHRNHYTKIANLAEKLAVELDEELNRPGFHRHPVASNMRQSGDGNERQTAIYRRVQGWCS